MRRQEAIIRREEDLAQIQNPPKRFRMTKTQMQAQQSEAETQEDRDAQAVADLWNQFLVEVEKEAVWNYFALFNNTFVTTLTETFVPDTPAYDPKYQKVREKCLALVRHCQNRMLDAAIAHVKKVKRVDALSDGSRHLESLTVSTDIHAFFEITFTKEKFFTVFFFMEPYLDFDRSKDGGRWYCKTVYTILCTRVFYHIDFLNEKVGNKFLNSRDELMDFVKKMVLTGEFNKIKRRHFYQKAGKLPKQCREKKPEVTLPTLGDRYHILTPMPDDSEDDEAEDDARAGLKQGGFFIICC
ncbi:hypothetical protein L207DRAFT_636132 [Hyaloscypha variabilis F]|uniref:Uncharacterized protein n=1 Tax=Hyaloscypha variabilis (strain UAMH 11265 / GT02V1 / F) TaxID=1149755 RepID=A0A2J6RFY7_HYAVF|nr:hypothetical protein L207DRAFT_636132 [Hyaloscypha variabilis F]